MLNLNSNLIVLVSSHAMYGWLTPRMQDVRPYHIFKGSSLLNQEASNAFLPFHYWNPCLKEHCYPTAILNFYRYLSCISRKCHTINGIRAVFINIQYASKLYNDNLEV